jgi:PKD repeat protein
MASLASKLYFFNKLYLMRIKFYPSFLRAFCVIAFLGLFASGKSQDVTAPGIPQNLRITALDHYHITVEWDACEDENGGSGLKGYPIGTGGTVIAYTDKYSTTNSYTIYFDAAWWAYSPQSFLFAVKAEDNAGNVSGFSTYLGFNLPPAPDTEAPSVPQNLHIVSLDHYHVTVAWDASVDNAGGSGVKGYPVWTCQTVWGGSDKYSTTNSYTINFNAAHYALPGAYFQIAAQAEDNAGNISARCDGIVVNIPPLTISDTEPPSTPTGLNGVATATNTTLSWTPSTDNVGVVSYEIVAFPGGVLPSPLPPPVIYTSTSASYIINQVPAGVMTYKVRAKDAAGNFSDYSTIITVQPPVIADVIAPGIPQNLHIVSLDHYQVTVAWDASTDNAGGSGLKGYPVGTGQTVIGGADKYTSTNSITINFNAAWWGLASQNFIIAAQAEDNAGNTSAFSTQLAFTIPPDLSGGISFYAADSSFSHVGSPVQFTFLPSNSAVNYTSFVWNFGDGSTSALMNPSHSYLQQGIYTVTLNATRADGTIQTVSKQNYIQVFPPVQSILDFTAQPTTVVAGMPVQFTSNVQAPVSSYLWFFNDGTLPNGGSSTLQNPTHVFQNPGVYSISMTVVYAGLTTSSGTTKFNYITVTAPPPGDVIPPSTPTGLNGVATPTNTTLSWTPSTDNVGVVSYEIVAFPGGILPSPLPSPVIYTSTSASYTINQVPAGVMTYKVRAKDAAGNFSDYSTIITIQPPVIADVIAPGIPQNLHIVSLDHYQVTVAWDASTDNAGGSGLKGYPVGTGQTVIGDTDKYSSTNTYTLNFDAAIWASPGQYFILAVKAEDNAGNISAFSNVITVNIPPVPVAVNFVASTTNAAAGTPINFTFQGGQITGSYTAWYWYFGDGSVSTVMNPAHVYTQPGIYPVSLAAIRSTGGADSIIKQNYITILPASPTVSFTFSPANAPAGTPVAFTYTGTNSQVASYLWSFGDGSVSTVMNPLHIYTQAGTYTVQLKVTYTDGLTETITRSNAVSVTTAIDNQAPTAPVNLRIVSLTPLQVTLTWDAATDNVGVVRYMKSTCQTVCGGIDDSTTANTYTINFTQPWQDIPGRWFKIAMAAKDAAGNVSGFSNWVRVDIPQDLKPDIIITAVQADKHGGIEGDAINGFFTIKNIGPGIVNRGEIIALGAIFRTSAWNTNQFGNFFYDTLSQPLKPNESTNIRFSIQSLKCIGTVNVIAKVNCFDKIPETSTINNEKEFQNVAYFLRDAAIPKPDLYVYDAEVRHTGTNATELQVGDSVYITFKIKNKGAADITNSTLFQNKFQYGSNVSAPNFFGFNLAAGRDTSIMLREKAIANANAFILTLDTGNDVYESDETNNVYVKQYLMPKSSAAPSIHNFLNGDNLYVTLPNGTDNNSVVTLRDMQGTLLRTFTYTGVKTFNWNVGNLVAGVYAITIEINHKPFGQQLMLVR